MKSCNLPRTRPRRPGFIALAVVALLGVSVEAHAETLRQRLPDGQNLNAEYRRGDLQRPAIVVLHGFLQTREFLTTQNIINNLAALGYTVLGPNLSLGISDRRQSLECQAPHKHRFEDDLREIDFWVSWLRKQGHAQVILVGHSWGAQHGLGYAERYPASPVLAILAISLVRAEQADQRPLQIRKAEERQARHDASLQPYALSFCKKFMATPASYLSYARWDDARVIDSLKQLQQRKLPVHVVLGGQDNRADGAWKEALQRHVSQVSVVDGANHFFSSMHEFDLNDWLDTTLARVSAPAPGK